MKPRCPLSLLSVGSPEFLADLQLSRHTSHIFRRAPSQTVWAAGISELPPRASLLGRPPPSSVLWVCGRFYSGWRESRKRPVVWKSPSLPPILRIWHSDYPDFRSFLSTAELVFGFQFTSLDVRNWSNATQVCNTASWSRKTDVFVSWFNRTNLMHLFGMFQQWMQHFASYGLRNCPINVIKTSGHSDKDSLDL